MKATAALFTACLVILLSLTAGAQESVLSRWNVNADTYFTFDKVTCSEQSDTVIFLGHVSIYSPLMDMEDCYRVVYFRKSGHLAIIPGGKLPVMKMANEGGEIVIQGRINDDNTAERKWFRYMEYTLGDKTIPIFN